MKLIHWWPPILGTGIWVKYISPNFDRYDVIMKLHWFNRNLLGMHYGGSLYSMCDPWYMFILTIGLGRNYIVVDKAAAIRYLKPGRGTLRATFHINEERMKEIKQEIDRIGKKDYIFLCEIKNEEGETVCEVDKVVYVRKKDFDWDAYNASGASEPDRKLNS